MAPSLIEVAVALLGEPEAELSVGTHRWFGSEEGNQVFVDTSSGEWACYRTGVRGVGADSLAAHLGLVERPPLPPEYQAERDFLGLLLNRPELVDVVLEDVVPGEFQADVHRKLLEAMQRALEKGGEITLPAVLAALEDDADLCTGWSAAAYVAHLIANAPLDEADAGELLARVRELGRAIREDADPVVRQERIAAALWEPRFGLVMWSDRNQTGEEYDYLVEDLIPERELVLIYGETQSGKSFFTRDLALAGARARPFMGRRIARAFGVAYCAYEAGHGMKARLRAYSRHHGLGADEELPFAVVTVPPNLWQPKGARGGEARAVDQLINEIGEIARYRFNGIGLGAVVIDTNNVAMTGASEIDSEAAGRIRETYHAIRRGLSAGVWIVSHKNAAGKHRGNEQLYNNLDTAIDISWKMTGTGFKAERIHDAEGRAVREAYIRKQREGSTGKLGDFVLEIVPTGGVNRYGKPRTSCVVSTVSSSAERTHEKAAIAQGALPLSSRDAVFFKALLEAVAASGVPPEPGLRLPVSITLVTPTTAVGQIYRSWSPPDPGETPEAYEKRIDGQIRRSREKLQNYRAIGILKGATGIHWIWPSGRRVSGPGLAWPTGPRLVSEQDAPAIVDAKTGEPITSIDQVS